MQDRLNSSTARQNHGSMEQGAIHGREDTSEVNIKNKLFCQLLACKDGVSKFRFCAHVMMMPKQARLMEPKRKVGVTDNFL